MERLEEIQTRMEAIKSEAAADGADLDALETETRALAEERKVLMAKVDAEIEMREAVAAGENITAVIAEREEVEPMETRITVESPEYRSAFYDYITTGSQESRSTLLTVDSSTTSGAGDAIAIPKTLDVKIWDNIHTAHPILADINTIASGIALEVTKHTAIATRVSGKKDIAQSAGAEDNTFVKVVLYGVDYEKYVELSYAEAKMSQGALEDYLAEEIAAELGEALAKDVFAKIKSDAGSAAATVTGTPTFTEMATLMGAASHAVKPVVYCSAAKYYALFGQVDNNGQPVFRDGVAIGAEVKIDSAAGNNYICVDPSKFVLNQVSPIVIESDKDIKNHHVVISGYLRAEGCMRVNTAAAWL